MKPTLIQDGKTRFKNCTVKTLQTDFTNSVGNGKHIAIEIGSNTEAVISISASGMLMLSVSDRLTVVASSLDQSETTELNKAFREQYHDD